ncbi:MAG: restriction endonuclease, partial [Betaproteobacteria bacterium]|nr:restriction endonuclease [Betaproteobacteria bacterium]
MNYPSIRIEGAILSPDILDRLEDAPGQHAADFGFDRNAKVKDEIARAWADAQDYWRIFQRKLETLRPDSAATTETRQQWVVPLLGLLGYQLEYQSRGAELNGKTYAISHRVANRGQTPVHITGCREPSGLDRKPEKAVLRMSAHAMVQEYLTLDEDLYGLVTNGRLLRLLRDSSRLVKLTYLEFDLDRIFTDGLFADFAVLYRLLHATRLPAAREAAAESLVERYHQDSLDSGSRIRDGLSRAVERAIRDFANGFLAHPANETLRHAAASGELKPDVYYQHLLRLIYRLLFLMVIEERGLVFPPKTAAVKRDIYDRYYSVQRLRRLS